VVEHGRTGLLCEERDAETLAANLGRLVRDRKVREEMGRCAYERAPSRHDIRVRVARITGYYRTLL